jgi:hypothetical protein
VWATAVYLCRYAVYQRKLFVHLSE